MNRKRGILLVILTVSFLLAINIFHFLTIPSSNNQKKNDGDDYEGDNDLLDYLTQPAKPRRYQDSYYLTSPAPKALATGHWITKTAMPVNRCDTPNGAIGQEGANNAIYEFGGENFNTSYTLNLKYDTKTDDWSVRAPMSQRREEFALGVWSGKMYAMGGHTWTVGGLQSTLNLVEEYNPWNNTWTAKNSMPNPRTWPATASYGDRIYVVGGWHRDTLVMFNNNDIYDPLNDTWTSGAPISPARCEFAAAVVNGSLYFIGGNDGANNPMNLNQKYDPVTNTWTDLAPMPHPRMRYAIAVMDNKIFCIGGAYTALDPKLATTINDVYDPATNTWATDEPMPTKRLNAGASVVDDRVYIIGGVNEDSYTIMQCLNVNEVFIPAIFSISVGAKPYTVYSGKQCQIDVNLTDGLYPVVGATIGLSDSGGGGSFGPVTDLGNGNYTATYTAPNVTFTKYITVTAQASKTGYSPKQKNCLVTVQPLPILTVAVDVSPSTVISGRNAVVNISVADGGTPISGAMIDLTDSKGGSFGPVTDKGGGEYTSMWTAPIVTTLQLVTITANASKVNYTTGQGTAGVMVKPYPTLQVSMYANPIQVTTGLNTTISIHLTDSINPVAGAKIDLSDNGGGGALGSVVDKGAGDYEAIYTTPIITSPKSIKITANASNPGYYNGTGSVNVGVNLVPTLQVAVSSNLSSIISGNSVKLTVKVSKSYVGIPLALVTLSDEGAGGLFGSVTGDGKGNYTASYKTALVPVPTIVKITANASKSGFNNGTGACDLSVELKSMSVSVEAANYAIHSSESVAITAKVEDSDSGKGLPGAIVTFSDDSSGGSFTTVVDKLNGDYTSTYTAPVVTSKQSIIVTVIASRPTYRESEGNCTLDVYPYEQKILYGAVTGNITSIPSNGTSEITVHITDGSADVAGASVSLSVNNGSCAPASGTTDIGGFLKSIFNAPIVNSSTLCKIRAVFSKTDYTSGEATLDIMVNPIYVPEADLMMSAKGINLTQMPLSYTAKIEIYVDNVGDAIANNVTLRVLVDNNTALNNTDIGTIDAGKRIYYKFFLYDISEGKHILTIQIDPENEISEIYEDNNVANMDFMFKAVEKSDSGTWTFIAIAIVVPIVLIFLLLFLMILRRRKKDEEEERQRAEDARQALMRQYMERMNQQPPGGFPPPL